MKAKKKKLVCDPWECPFCVYIGEGDFICDKYAEHYFVKSDWEPTEDYLICEQKKGEKHG